MSGDRVLLNTAEAMHLVMCTVLMAKSRDFEEALICNDYERYVDS